VAPPGAVISVGGWKRSWFRERKPLKRRCQAKGFGKKTQERITSEKSLVRHEVGIKLWRVKPKSVGG
jgi:hypothetical protein